MSNPGDDAARRFFSTVYVAFHPQEDGTFVPADQGGEIIAKEKFTDLIDKANAFYSNYSSEDIETANRENKERREQRFQDAKSLKASHSKAKPGIVYLIRENQGGFFKIGKSTDFKRRKSSLNLHLPVGYEVIHTINTQDIDRLERELHARFASKRMQGEWFDLTEEDVVSVKGIV